MSADVICNGRLVFTRPLGKGRHYCVHRQYAYRIDEDLGDILVRTSKWADPVRKGERTGPIWAKARPWNPRTKDERQLAQRIKSMIIEAQNAGYARRGRAVEAAVQGWLEGGGTEEMLAHLVDSAAQELQDLMAS